ncbi:tRNA lysidine(34) synthetase TilS [Flavobacteriaceae bacterium TK19130]|nr:tRNA lysidine(34) synthetase TilS [Thermobacterium salinum]
MEKKFERHIDAKFPELKSKKIVLACSGGVDSIALSHLLKRIGCEFALAHCNFSLRGEESDEDETFVIDWADRLSVAVFTETFDTKAYAKEHKVSTQMAARDLRYEWFSQLMVDTQYEVLVTAHHADDALETILINLSRGTGLRGLSGIPDKEVTIMRPLLAFTKVEVLAYAKKENLYWREDSSNASDDYLRNEIRHQVIPPLKKATKGDLLQAVQRTQSHLRQSQALIEDYMALVYNLAVTENFDGYTLHIDKLQELPNTKAILYELLHPFGFTAWEDISELLTAQSGKQIFSDSFRLLKDRNVILLTERDENDDETDARDTFLVEKGVKQITKPIALKFSPIGKIGNPTTTEIVVDADLLKYPLEVRKWREGDVFQPFGMRGKKKLSKFFKDEKLSLLAKEKIWVLTSNDTIVWVIGHRADDRFKVTPETKQKRQITYTPSV